MARDLFSSKKNSNVRKPNISMDQAKKSGMDVDGLSEMAKSMSGKSEAELQHELFKMADMQMAQGTFDPEALESFAKQAGPMLSPDQQKKMRTLINGLKSKSSGRR